ncbi:hypothetical protein Avbf_17731 [Armadillidium vulgare]|nr:hypothetical protein Avbf_17731 [Armadillidium vulgare]
MINIQFKSKKRKRFEKEENEKPKKENGLKNKKVGNQRKKTFEKEENGKPKKENANPEPTNSKPTNSEPKNPEPTNSESTNSEPTNSGPTNSDSTNSEPTNPESTNPKPINSESPNPEDVSSGPLTFKGGNIVNPVQGTASGLVQIKIVKKEEEAPSIAVNNLRLNQVTRKDLEVQEHSREEAASALALARHVISKRKYGEQLSEAFKTVISTEVHKGKIVKHTRPCQRESEEEEQKSSTTKLCI